MVIVLFDVSKNEDIIEVEEICLDLETCDLISTENYLKLFVFEDFGEQGMKVWFWVVGESQKVLCWVLKDLLRFGLKIVDELDLDLVMVEMVIRE